MHSQSQGCRGCTSNASAGLVHLKANAAEAILPPDLVPGLLFCSLQQVVEAGISCQQGRLLLLSGACSELGMLHAQVPGNGVAAPVIAPIGRLQSGHATVSLAFFQRSASIGKRWLTGLFKLCQLALEALNFPFAFLHGQSASAS